MELVARRYKTVFFGTPDFAVPSLEALYDLRPLVDLAAVVTAPDKAVGRERILMPSPVKIWAKEHGTTVLQPNNLRSSDFLVTIAGIAPDVGVIASYGKIIPPELLVMFPKGILNVHPSLLPRWRGPSPIQAAIAAGDIETGVTVHLIDETLDGGPILAQESFPLRGNETVEQLTAYLAQRGGALLGRTLLAWLRNEITPRPQPEDGRTDAKMLRRDDGRVRFDQPADAILRMVRAYGRWPGVFTVLPDGSRLKILEAAAVFPLGDDRDPPGTIREDATGTPIVKTTNGWLRLILVQREGKTPTHGEAFLRGHRDFLGKRLS